MKFFDANYEVNMRWIEKTGLLNNKVNELFSKLSPEFREEVFMELFTKLYPKAVVSKHPSKEVYLLKLDELKLFFDVNDNKVIMPVKDDEPRVFPAGEFFENLPKLKEFIKYLDDYSMRRRRGFTF